MYHSLHYGDSFLQLCQNSLIILSLLNIISESKLIQSHELCPSNIQLELSGRIPSKYISMTTGYYLMSGEI